MNRVKKISIVLLLIILVLYIFMNKTYAVLNCNVNLSASKNKVTYKEQFSVYVSISNLKTTKGILAIGAVLSYDTSSLTLIDIQGENKWSDPFYNDSNGKFTLFKNELSTSNENILKLTFKVNEKGKSSKSTWIKISNLEISDGDEEKDCGGNSINIMISEPDNGNSGNNSQGGNHQGNNSGNNNQNLGNNHQKPGNNSEGLGNSTIKKPTVNNSINDQKENLNNEQLSNSSSNSLDTNTVENTVGKDFEEDKDTIENNMELEETEGDKKISKGLFYTISIVAIIVIAGLVFLMEKYWKTDE